VGGLVVEGGFGSVVGDGNGFAVNVVFVFGGAVAAGVGGVVGSARAVALRRQSANINERMTRSLLNGSRSRR
jgi:hypothetical protein